MFVLVCAVYSSVPQNEIHNLFLLFESTGGEQWEWQPVALRGQKWNFTTDSAGSYVEDPCSSSWQGVTCSSSSEQCAIQTCHIVSISLESYRLTGTLPSSIGSDYIEFLDLSKNRVGGKVPSDLASLPVLKELNLAHNIFTGSLPNSITQLIHLEIIDFSYNNISGALPEGIGALTNLTFLDLNTNKVTGSIPTDIGSLVKLTCLNLQRNRFHRSIPSEINALSNLEILDIRHNILDSPHPFEFCSFPHLKHFNIRSNFLEGSIPEDISCLTRLSYFNIYRNNLTSSLPSSLSALTDLAHFQVGYNFLTGVLPMEIFDLTSLTHLALSGNELIMPGGSLPPVIGNLVQLTYLELAEFSLTGSLPIELANLTNLERLYLMDNDITGYIPPLDALVDLEILFLFGNSLSGPISQSIFGLTKLRTLNLGENMLTGTIPHDYVRLKSCTYLSFSGNLLTGGLPPELPPKVVLLYLGVNMLTGPLTSQFICASNVLINSWINDNMLTGSLPHLECASDSLIDINVHSNRLTGTIHSQIGDIFTLNWLRLDYNELTGTIPPELGQLVLLESFALARNFLTGTLPNLADLKQLDMLLLFDNMLSGPIPSHYGNFEQLRYFELDGNMLSGDIPSSLGALNWALQILLFDNMLSGTLPEIFYNLTRLQVLSCQSNLLMGTISESISNMISLQEFTMEENFFSRFLPSEIGNLYNLQSLVMSNNIFEGTIPLSYSKLSALDVFIFQGNVLTGKLNGIFDLSNHQSLYMVDLSNNLFSGTIPHVLFMLPSILTIVLSGNNISRLCKTCNICELAISKNPCLCVVNCFSGELPTSLCQAKSVEVLCLDGLRGASGCPNNFYVPLFDVALFNYIDGSIPECVWKLKNLTYIHLAGNGLTGTISSPSDSTQLSNVVLSYNQLSGTIPSVTQQLHTLDLSHNSFHGNLDFNVSKFSHSIELSVNRLSGDLQTTSWLERVPYLDILESNLFRCGKIPHNDEYYQFYSCESEELDISLYILAVAFAIGGCVVLPIVAFSSVSKDYRNKLWRYCRSLSIKYINYLEYFRSGERLSQFDNEKEYKVAFVVQAMGEKALHFMYFVLFILMTTIPSYIFKATEDDHMVYQDSYRWFWTYAYMSGERTTIFVVSSWIAIVVLYFAYSRLVQPSQDIINFREKFAKFKIWEDTDSSFEFNRMKLTGHFFLNIIINVIVNGSYVYLHQQNSSSGTQLMIQMAMATFKMLYTLMCVPLLASHISSSTPNIWFRLILLIINNLVIPCFVVVVESSTCFQGLFFANDDIISYYSIDYCDTYTAYYFVKICTADEFQHDNIPIAPLTPPFIYNYQCASSVLTSYIPVYLYIYAFLILLPFVYVMLLTQFKYDELPHVFRLLVHAIVWPKHFIEDEDVHPSDNESSLKFDHFMIFDTRDIVTTDVLNHLIVLLSFGLCSPLLTLAIGLTVYLKLNMWVLLVGRFASYFEYPKQPARLRYAAFHTLSKSYLSLAQVYHQTMWPLIWSSAIFFAFVGWDFCADEVGWKNSLWVPFLVISVPISMRLFECILKRADVQRIDVDRGPKSVELLPGISSFRSRNGNPIELEDNLSSVVNPLSKGIAENMDVEKSSLTHM